jgi:hypothetical protein
MTGMAAADVAEAEHGGTVAHHGDGVARPGVLAGEFRLVRDGAADPGHAGRIGHGERGTVRHVHGRPHVDLAAPVHREDGVGSKGSMNRNRLVAHG